MVDKTSAPAQHAALHLNAETVLFLQPWRKAEMRISELRLFVSPEYEIAANPQGVPNPPSLIVPHASNLLRTGCNTNCLHAFFQQ